MPETNDRELSAYASVQTICKLLLGASKDPDAKTVQKALTENLYEKNPYGYQFMQAHKLLWQHVTNAIDGGAPEYSTLIGYLNSMIEISGSVEEKEHLQRLLFTTLICVDLHDKGDYYRSILRAIQCAKEYSSIPMLLETHVSAMGILVHLIRKWDGQAPMPVAMIGVLIQVYMDLAEGTSYPHYVQIAQECAQALGVLHNVAEARTHMIMRHPEPELAIRRLDEAFLLGTMLDKKTANMWALSEWALKARDWPFFPKK